MNAFAEAFSVAKKEHDRYQSPDDTEHSEAGPDDDFGSRESTALADDLH